MSEATPAKLSRPPGGILRRAIFKALEYGSSTMPRPLRALLRPPYDVATRIGFVRKTIWGSASREVCHAYWSAPLEAGNTPEAYLNDHRAGSLLMLSYIRRHVNTDARILEIGCNAGRNLRVLYEAGYHNLSGIEINRTAVELMQHTYPEMTRDMMTRDMRILVSPVERAIQELHTGEFDVVFTMAVLEHIHPDSIWVFAEIARVARRLVVTLEDEASVSWRTFARNYKDVFEPLGLTQVEYDDCKSLPEWHPRLRLRVFAK